MLVTRFVLTSFIVLCNTEAMEYSIGGAKVPKFDRFNGMCRGNKDTKITFDYYGVKHVDNKLVMNCTITVKEDIVNPPTFSLMIQRCKSKENPDSCENFFAFNTKKYCQMISSSSELWNPFFSTIEPKWKCPIKKGLYKSINSEFDIKAILLFPVDGWFWKVRGDMYDSVSGKRIMCILVEATVYSKRN